MKAMKLSSKARGRSRITKRSDKKMNLLTKINEKKSKLESMNSVKLDAVKSEDGIVVLTHSGMVVPSNEVQKFEYNTVFVSGKFASEFAFQAAIRQNKI